MSFVLIFLSSNALAAGGPADLLWPTVNFLILASVIIWKLKKPVTEHFKNNSHQVETSFERAGSKSREAKLKLEELEGKLSNADGERSRILGEANEQFTKTKTQIETETSDRIERLKEEASNKVKVERMNKIRGLSDELLNTIIADAKSKVATDPAVKSKASKKLLSQIQ